MPVVSQLFAVVALSLLACLALHIMSSCAFHLHTCSSHASDLFPRCPFCNGAPISPGVPFYLLFHVWALNISGLDRDFSCGLGLLPVDRLTSFVPFGLRLILQRLTGEPRRPHVCCSPIPLQNDPITHPNHSYVLRRRITIVWVKTIPHPSSRSFDHDRLAENRTSFGLSYLPLHI